MSSIQNSNQTVSGDTTPLFWNRMLRFSIYFTILGVGLGFILGKMLTNTIDSANAQKQSNPRVMYERVDSEGRQLDNQKLTPAEREALPKDVDPHSNEVVALTGKAKAFMIFVYMAPFLLMGILSILTCLFMRKRERKARLNASKA